LEDSNKPKETRKAIPQKGNKSSPKTSPRENIKLESNKKQIPQNYKDSTVTNPSRQSRVSNSGSERQTGSALSSKDSSIGPQSVSGRPQSARGRKAQPVHASAPFQTNPSHTSAKHQTTYRAATTNTIRQQAKQHARQAVSGKIRNNVVEKPQNSRTQNTTKDSRGKCSGSQKEITTTRDKMMENTKKLQFDETNNSNDSLEEKCLPDKSCDSNELSERLQQLTVNNHNQAQPKTQPENDVDVKQKQFSLVNDGYVCFSVHY